MLGGCSIKQNDMLLNLFSIPDMADYSIELFHAFQENGRSFLNILQDTIDNISREISQENSIKQVSGCFQSLK